LNEELPYEEAGAMLLIEVDGSNAAQVEQEYETIGELCLANGAIEVYVADNHTTQERVWAVRRNIAEAFKVYSPEQSLEDIVVPTSQIPELIPELERAVLMDLYQVVADLGGTISGEHGIGSKRREFMPLIMDGALIALQQRIKTAFDPNNILNPGKIFPQ
jgi:glycolate oxidase